MPPPCSSVLRTPGDAPRTPASGPRSVFRIFRGCNNEKHPDLLQFFAENSLTLRETAIENWHSILYHYFNRHVTNVKNEHYEKASCSAKQLRATKTDLKEHLLKRKPQPPERLGLLQKMGGEALDETKKHLASFLLHFFTEMVAQLKADKVFSGDYADAMWPRESSAGLMTRGMAGFMKALALTEAFDADFRAPAAPEGLRAQTEAAAARAALERQEGQADRPHLHARAREPRRVHGRAGRGRRAPPGAAQGLPPPALPTPAAVAAPTPVGGLGAAAAPAPASPAQEGASEDDDRESDGGQDEGGNDASG